MRTLAALITAALSLMGCGKSRPSADQANALVERAVRSLDGGRFDDALRDLDEAIRVDPSNAAAFSWRGAVRLRREEYDRAIDDATEAIRLDPGHAGGYEVRGSAWGAKGEPDRAIGDCDEAIRLDPRNAVAYQVRGAARLRKGEYDRAIEDCSEAIRLDPRMARAFLMRGHARNWTQRYAEARQDYESAIRLGSSDVEVLNSVAWNLATHPDARARDGAKAVELARRAVELGGRYEQRDTLAAAYAEVGDFEAAVAESRRALQSPAIDPGDREQMEGNLKLLEERKPIRQLPRARPGWANRDGAARGRSNDGRVPPPRSPAEPPTAPDWAGG